MTMIDITPDTTLGDLVTSRPELARQLERRGLDYCCGGQRSLGAAAEAAGLDAGLVVSELTAACAGNGAVTPAWATLDPAALADHIEDTHHRYLHAELPRLDALVDKITAVHGARHPELIDVRATFGQLRADLEPHLQREERVLFPAIRRLVAAEDVPAFAFGTVHHPISVMMADHDVAGELLARLRALTGGYEPPADGCASYRACYEGLAELEQDVHLHVHKENNVLFPAVVRLEHYRGESGRR